MADYAGYEREKRRLQALNLPAEEYERRLREIARKYGV